MVQSVGYDPFLTSFASADQRRPTEREPDSRRVTPATENESSAADRRQPDPSDDLKAEAAPAPPRPTRVAFTAKFGPDSDGFPLQLIRGEQGAQPESADFQASGEKRKPQEETRAAQIQAQEARDDAIEATRRQQEASSARRETAEAVQNDSEPDVAPPGNRQQPAGSFLDLQV